MGASLYEFRDLDLMLKIEAEADYDGWVGTEQLAHLLGFKNGDGTFPVAHRLSWMKRFGMVDYDGEKRMWRLSEGGRRVTASRLRAAQSKAIEAIPDESMIEVMAGVTTRYVHGSPMLAHMLRREFMYGTQPGGRRRR